MHTHSSFWPTSRELAYFEVIFVASFISRIVCSSQHNHWLGMVESGKWVWSPPSWLGIKESPMGMRISPEGSEKFCRSFPSHLLSWSLFPPTQSIAVASWLVFVHPLSPSSLVIHPETRVIRAGLVSPTIVSSSLQNKIHHWTPVCIYYGHC